MIDMPMNLTIDVPPLEDDIEVTVAYRKLKNIRKLSEGLNVFDVEREGDYGIAVTMFGIKWLVWQSPVLPFESGASFKIEVPIPKMDGFITENPDHFEGVYELVKWERSALDTFDSIKPII